MPKRPSFQYYTANWRGSKWVGFDPCDAHLLPRLPGCYVVYLDGQLAYVGQTSDIRNRFQHYGIRDLYGGCVTTPWGVFRKVLVKVRFADRYGDWLMREVRLIQRLNPPRNRVKFSGRKRVTNV